MVVDHPEDTLAGPVFRLAFVVPWVVLGLTTIAVVVGGTPPRQYQLFAFAASIVLFGLPHGAVDHRTLPWERDEPLTRRWLLFIGGVYLVCGLVYTAIWFVGPVIAFVLFIAITVAHWGQGDLYPLVALVEPTHLRTRTARMLSVATRGALPMLVPLVAFPNEYQLVAETLVGLFGGDTLGIVTVVLLPPSRLVVAVCITVLIITAVAAGDTSTRTRRAWLIDTGETVFLTVYFVLVPPILAIGIYFCFWHSLRHVVRLMLLAETTRTHLTAGAPGRAIARFARAATPLSVGGLAIIGGIAIVVPVFPVSHLDMLGVYLVGIAVLTLPHVIVVTWLDFETGLY